MIKFFVNLAYFSKAIAGAFRMFFLKPIKQIHNEEQETDKQKFARIPIGIYPVQFFVTQFQIIHNLQKVQNEALLKIINGLETQNKIILDFLKTITS